MNDHNIIVGILRKITHFSWFYEQFTMVNGFKWLSNIGLNNHNRSIVLDLLVDQIVFESVSPDINVPFEFLYLYLQNSSRTRLELNISLGGFEWLEWCIFRTTEPSKLQDALIWVLGNAAKMRNRGVSLVSEGKHEVPSFASIGLRKAKERRPIGQIRSFKFAKEMSDEGWEDWTNKIKSMAMGLYLNGLGCGPKYAQHKFVRDPDGICGSTCSV
jgi:hypothetical protein